MEKVLKGKHFASAEKVKQELAEALKDIEISKFKTVLSSGKIFLICVLHQMESALKATEV